MKFLHLGDLHLGKSLNEFDLYEDQKFILNQIMGIVKEEKIDSVLIAGDVYDRAIPSEAATRLLDDFLFDLNSNNVKVFVISGNHDSDDRLNFGSRVFESKGIFISSIYDGKLQCHKVEDEYGEVNVYLLPFVKASQVRHFYPEEKIETYDDAVRVIIDKAGVDEQARNIIVAHQFVAGNDTDPALSGSEGAAVLNVGLVEKIGYGCFDRFDYAALGHIHSPQRIGRDEVRYSGSPLKYSLSEVNNDKTVPIITVEGKGEVKIELVPLKPMRNLRHIKGKLAEVLDKENITDTEDFIYVTLTDENIVNDAMGIIQQYYPNTIKIDYDNSHTKEIENVDLSSIADNRSFPELISEFYRMMYGCDISEEEMEIMRMVAQEAGVMNEAD